MRYLIEHRTRIEFEKPVREHQCELRIAPRANGQNVLELEIETDPRADLASYIDAFGNTVSWFGIVEPHDSLSTSMRTRVETALANPFDYEAVELQRERAWIDEALWREPSLWDFVLHRSPATPELAKAPFAERYPTLLAGKPVLDSVQTAVAWIGEHFRYDAAATEVHSTLAEVLEARAGVCQDFAHLLVAIVRSWGVPARYAVGYLDPQSVPGDEEVSGATHAWAQVLIPGAGWRGFDATNGLVVNDTYVCVAVGRDYVDAAPQRGSFKGADAGSKPEVSVEVTREG